MVYYCYTKELVKMIRKNVVLLLAFAVILSGAAFAAPTNASAQDGASAQGFLFNK